MSEIITDLRNEDFESFKTEYANRLDKNIESIKAVNLRAPNEYRIVADGETLYRLAPNFPIPKGLTEVLKYQGRNIYQSSGKLKRQFMALQRIQPRNNMTRLVRSIKVAIHNWE